MTDSVRNLGKDLAAQKQSIAYHANILNLFVESGYEVHSERIKLGEWWKEKETTMTHKIFFQRDYSSRPQLFFGVNELKRFAILEKSESNEKKNIILSVTLKEVMTSYFSVEVKITCNSKINPEIAMSEFEPEIGITYVLLNKRSE